MHGTSLASQCSNSHAKDNLASPHQVENDETNSEQQRQQPAMNTTNLCMNAIFGNDMNLPKDKNTTRLISQNVNGICRGDDYQDILQMSQAFKTSSVNWISLGETNIDWQSTARSKLYSNGIKYTCRCFVTILAYDVNST